MTVTDETEAEVRRLREEAIARGEAILSGRLNPKDGGDTGVVNEDGVKNDIVEDEGGDSPEVVEVDQDNPAPEPTE